MVLLIRPSPAWLGGRDLLLPPDAMDVNFAAALDSRLDADKLVPLLPSAFLQLLPPLPPPIELPILSPPAPGFSSSDVVVGVDCDASRSVLVTTTGAALPIRAKGPPTPPFDDVIDTEGASEHARLAGRDWRSSSMLSLGGRSSSELGRLPIRWPLGAARVFPDLSK